MISRIKSWWKVRGERKCAADDHAWKETDAPPLTIEDLMLGASWHWAKCKRCGIRGRSPRY